MASGSSQDQDQDPPSAIVVSQRYPKRKRKAESFYYQSEEEDSEYLPDEELDLQPKKKKVKRAPVVKEEKPFPFLLLPPELRNEIYGWALADFNTSMDKDKTPGLWLKHVTKSYRATVERFVPNEQYYNQTPTNLNYYYRRRPTIYEDIVRTKSPLGLFATCKQIYDEAAPLLYSNRLVFADSVAMSTFVGKLSFRSAQLLRHIEVRSWGEPSGGKQAAITAMTHLANLRAFKIEKFHINCNAGACYIHSSQLHIARKAAQHTYRTCFPWLDAIENYNLRNNVDKNDCASSIEVFELAATNCTSRSASDASKAAALAKVQPAYEDFLWELIQKNKRKD